MRFAPVFLPEDRGLNGKASQTFLRHYNQCPRSAYLYQALKGEAQTANMMRGSALHAILERATNLALEQGEPSIPPELAKAIADEVLAEYPVPIEEHDYVRESVYRWAGETRFDSGAVVAVESLFVLDLAGFEVRCKIDYAELSEFDGAATVRDYKSGRGAPALEEVSRRRQDGSLAAKSFQLILYALALAYGVRVAEEECRICMGLGDVADIPEYEMTFVDTPRRPCMRCEGRGYEEVPEPFPIADRSQHFTMEFIYPGIEDAEGKMLRRSVTLTRLELDEYRTDLEGLLGRVAESERTGDWPAVVSDAACGECPASQCCPIPSELRDHRGEINSVEQATEAAEVHDRVTAEMGALRKEIKSFCKAHDLSLRFGSKVFEFVPKSSVRVDREGLVAAARRAAEFGEPFDEAVYMKVSNGTDFRARDLTADELSEGSNEQDVASANRYGDDPPF